MSYIDQAAFSPAQTATCDNPEIHNTLSDLERRVVRLSLLDTETSLASRHTRLARLLAIVAGRQSMRLANPRLEAMRRYSVRFRLGGGSTDYSEKLMVHDAGYTEQQVRAIEQLVHQLQPPLGPRPHPGRAVLIILCTLFSVLGCAWLSRTIEDSLIAVVIFGVLAASILAAFSRQTQ